MTVAVRAAVSVLTACSTSMPFDIFPEYTLSGGRSALLAGWLWLDFFVASCQ